MRRRHLLAGAAGGSTALARQAPSPPAPAEAWPIRPVTIPMPFVAGGPSDIVARAIATRVQQGIGQPVVAESRTGANGEVAARVLARAALTV